MTINLANNQKLYAVVVRKSNQFAVTDKDGSTCAFINEEDAKRLIKGRTGDPDKYKIVPVKIALGFEEETNVEKLERLQKEIDRLKLLNNYLMDCHLFFS